MKTNGNLSKVKIKKLKVYTDHRGWLAEILKLTDLRSDGFGQLFVTVANPEKTKGNHYHTKKREWFCVVSGEGELILKDVKNGSAKKIRMSGNAPKIVEIPPYVAHAITNRGKDSMVLLVCANEVFNPKKPDTHSYSVLKV